MTPAPEELKACCTALYSSPAARWLLGDSLHPGGPALTARLIAALEVGPGDLVVDMASGVGTSAIQLAGQTGCRVVGVDLSAENVAASAAAAEREGLSERVRFLRGDAEALPLAVGSADGALCEWALCTFPDKERAAAELARVLRPRGRLALSDVTADRERLPEELRSAAAWTACVAGALPLGEIAGLLGEAGLAVETVERHDEFLAALIERVDERLRAARLLVPGPVAETRRPSPGAPSGRPPCLRRRRPRLRRRHRASLTGRGVASPPRRASRRAAASADSLSSSRAVATVASHRLAAIAAVRRPTSQKSAPSSPE